ncbi:hypothetical protein [Chitinilyticum aquatile]|uniref:hypothetical protein n=1 Tax=Chitinilyticum aquatile TaxID=362520 RepID=UPI00040DAC0C|nr:hypothetical protein [Chitinilyticum aquatile]
MQVPLAAVAANEGPPDQYSQTLMPQALSHEWLTGHTPNHDLIMSLLQKRHSRESGNPDSGVKPGFALDARLRGHDEKASEREA